MKKKLYMDELESFLADSADEVRMYPSDRIWRQIDRRLHGEKNWPALNFAAFLIGVGMLAALWLIQPEKDLFVTTADPIKIANPNIVAGKSFSIATSLLPTQAHLASTNKGANSEAASAFAPALENRPTNNHKQISDTHLAGLTTNEPTLAAGNQLEPLNESLPTQELVDGFTAGRLSDPLETSGLAEHEILMSAILPNPLFAEKAAATTPSSAVADKTAATESIQQDPIGSKKRWNLQYYATPSLSYRLLNQDEDYNKTLLSAGLIPANSFNQVGDAVSQRRDMGIEVGAAAGYQVSEKLLIKAGLQLNYRAFNIDAFQLQSAQATTLRLRQGNVYDSVYAISNMGNFAGNTPVNLTNRFLQISVPIGFELAMATWGKTGFFVGTTLQPTYNLQQHAWQLSADFQHYVQQPDLLQSFTLNSAIEAFFRFQTKGGLHWQLGPQIRYQLSSTTQKAYPIREHLIDYGLKIGVMKTLQ